MLKKFFTGRLKQARSRLGFLRGSMQLLLLWPAICLFLAALMWGIILNSTESDRSAIEKAAVKESASLVQAYSQHLSTSLDQIDQITLHVRHAWENDGSAINLEELARKGLYPASDQIFVTIVDREGNPVTSSRPIGTPFNIANHDYFVQHSRTPASRLVIGTPLPAPDARGFVIRFTRRLSTPDGGFGGIVMVSVAPSYLATFYSDASLGRKGFLAVRGTRDGMVRTSKVGNTVMPSPKLVMRISLAGQAAEGVLTADGDNFIDNEARLVAWSTLKRHPMVAIVGLSRAEVLSAHEAAALTHRNIAIAGTLLLLVSALLATALSLRLAWRKQQAEDIKNTYRLAIDGAREGFYMVRAVYDEGNQLVDFLIEDCNERGAVFVGYTRATLVGTRFSELYSGERRTRVTQIFRAAMETGFYEDEFRIVHPDSPARTEWMHRRLVRSGAGLAMTVRDITDIKAHEKALSDLANADAMTGLPNRHWLITYLPGAIECAARAGSGMAMMFVDLDDFKHVNDTLGHAAGDELLRNAAERLKSLIRPNDRVLRLGGDEFTIVLHDVQGEAEVAVVAQRIANGFHEPFHLPGGHHTVCASIGISLFPRDGLDVDSLLKNADIAMYAAKSRGKGNYCFYQARFGEAMKARFSNEQALRRAIDQDEFVLHYQPRVDTFTGQLCGMEALVRWQDPSRGLVAPIEFIPLAEETGLIIPLGAMVMRKAVAQLALWRDQGLPLVPVSINVSWRQFDQGGIDRNLAECIAQHVLNPALIDIELTESCMRGDDLGVPAQLAAIRGLGIKLMVDDFGTGYSSLSQLQRLDLDMLKVDRSFTDDLGSKEGNVFFKAIISMAHALGMTVVAEGVETEHQLRMLQALACDEIQGFLIARPVPADAMPALMQRRFLFPGNQAAPRPTGKDDSDEALGLAI